MQGDGRLLAGLSSLEQALAKASRYDQRSTSLLERLRSVRIELQDIGHEASGPLWKWTWTLRPWTA